MIYVVDQNMMRSERLRDIIRSEPRSGFVIPDAAFEEMIKHRCWEDTMRGSLEAFAPILDRTFCSAPTGELLAYERRTRGPIGLEHLFPVALTDLAHEIIAGVVSGSERIGEIRRTVEARRDAVLAERPDGPTQKDRVPAAVARLASLDGPELVGDVRSGRMSAGARLGLMKVRAEALVRQFLGFDPHDAGCFPMSGLMTTRYVYAHLWYQDRWLRFGGSDEVDPAKVANDDFDQDYALVATYVDGLLTRDRKASECADDLRLLTQPEKDAELMDAVYAHAFATGRLSQAGAGPSPAGGLPTG